jgi:signal transduction histidine kinase
LKVEAARRNSAPRLLVYVLSIAAALALTVALAVTIMRPPLGDLMELALLFAITGSGSAFIGFVSHRLGWWRRLGSLRQTLTLGYVIAAGLTLLNVWLTARLMFINDHDLALAGLLLLFAGGISVSFGYFLSASIAQSLGEMVRAAGRLSEGDFSARVPATGHDEVAQLALAFNGMAERLEKVDADTRALEAARRDLVAWASHDLRTPLASLRAMIDALADGVVADADSVQRYLSQCQSETSRMSALIDDLFELVQIDAGSLVLRCEPSSLTDLVSDTLEAFSARAQASQVRLTGWVDPRVDPVWMSADSISRVLGNLLDNALRHTPPGGTIELRAEAEDERVLIWVADSGAGIPARDLPRIFERFYRGDAARTRGQAGDGPARSAGLGLAIARGLVEAHAGQIWAESQPGRGATLKFTLPKSRPAATGG